MNKLNIMEKLHETFGEEIKGVSINNNEGGTYYVTMEIGEVEKLIRKEESVTIDLRDGLEDSNFLKSFWEFGTKIKSEEFLKPDEALREVLEKSLEEEIYIPLCNGMYRTWKPPQSDVKKACEDFEEEQSAKMDSIKRGKENQEAIEWMIDAYHVTNPGYKITCIKKEGYAIFSRTKAAGEPVYEIKRWSIDDLLKHYKNVCYN